MAHRGDSQHDADESGRSAALSAGPESQFLVAPAYHTAHCSRFELLKVCSTILTALEATSSRLLAPRSHPVLDLDSVKSPDGFS